MIILSGCATAPAPDCGDCAGVPAHPASTFQESPAAAPIGPASAATAAELPFTVRLEACQGFAASAEIERSAVQHLLGSAFRPLGVTSSTASVLLEWSRCDRFIGHGWVQPNATRVHALIRVEPVNSSWAEQRTSLLLIDFFSTASAMVAALEKLGVPAVLGTEQVAHRQLADASLRLAEWSLRAPSSEIRVSFITDSRPGGQQEAAVNYWLRDADDFRRFEGQRRTELGQPGVQPARLELDGACEICALSESLPVVWALQPVMKHQEDWVGHTRFTS